MPLPNLITVSRCLPRASRPAFAALLVNLLLLLFTLPAAAQAPDAAVKFFRQSPDDQPNTVGDRITLRLEVTHPLDSKADLPQLEVGQAWGDFEVVGQTEPEVIDNHNGTATTAKEMTVTMFQPGQYQTPKLIVTHHFADGTTEELASPVIQLTVTSVLTDDLDLRDLKPQADLPMPPLWPYIVVALFLTMLILGLLAGLGLWWYDRRKRRARLEQAPVPVMDTRPPEAIAYAELERIETLNLPAQHQIKTYYSLVDLCLRQYLEGRYQIPALEQTRAELQAAFRRSPVPAEHTAEFMSLFTESDLVKFARYVPNADNVYSLINRARTLVEITTPVTEEIITEPMAPEPEVGL